MLKYVQEIINDGICFNKDGEVRTRAKGMTCKGYELKMDETE